MPDDLPVRVGEFVWSHFPEHERPALPGSRHIGYVVHVAMLDGGGWGAVLAYTTSTGLIFAGRQPLGVHPFAREQAASLGQKAAFRLDLKRLAYVPITSTWFPDLALPHRGVTGRAPRPLRAALQASLDDLLLKHKELVGRLGPLWTPR